MSGYKDQHGHERQQFKATVMWNDIINYLNENLPIPNKSYKKKGFQNSFTGKELLRVLASFAKEKDKQLQHAQLCKLGQYLIDRNVLIRLDSKLAKFRTKNSTYCLVNRKNSDTKLKDYNLVKILRAADGSKKAHTRSATSKISDITGGSSYEMGIKSMTREIALRRLLQLIEIPFLEDVMKFRDTMSTLSLDQSNCDGDDFQSFLAIISKQNYSEIYHCQSDTDKTWVALAFNCLNKPWPEEEGSFTKNSAHEARKELFYAVLRRYDSLSQPLLPPSLTESLRKLLSSVINDNSVPMKRKEIFLKLFLKHHPDASFTDTRNSEYL
ncbi:uncharacterized protein TRIADDRAFT_61786 [Trichoplax adhaerens]|uniref:DEP domain-containing protein n=1 Tax=Trichoplax adhaerens TaxID=10228 RepID=B3SBY8_TRIAD|nr:hypothetical protein TRIADDRAFT_61786 [Trichoplax adhaerens]EDV19757.1 hypothetical protein TRIADDRAFT_61786 [Trichoplax adhaerens]|eukprot:XP_002117781.1 hypothetical protein TRIADDRAFT_61786 [Trichoplax adhaerens]